MGSRLIVINQQEGGAAQINSAAPVDAISNGF
jgi:hypothetical protein